MNLSANLIHLIFESFFDLFTTASWATCSSMSYEAVVKTTKKPLKITNIKFADEPILEKFMRNLLSSFSDRYDMTEQGQYRDGDMAARSHVIDA